MTQFLHIYLHLTIRNGETRNVEERGGAVDHCWQLINYRFNDHYSGPSESITSGSVQHLM